MLREQASTLNFDVWVPVGRLGECLARMRAKLERGWLTYSRTPAEIAPMRTLKAALDPRRILNPGKML
ncbi:MAG TPA: FAD-linked oxidase C-terminal domain-containing protein [Thauera aminoaromatica]|nr:FAD-linked oxidase C-terminal domain-containing protein [Thauera aminoaromatica]HMX14748.1 FAD-linked oxidase C-terminal domain-containing protein [Thauera aminoaromatica]HMZ29552.1 FAD-linked oxidase C-terminal domain-containing protein [Thauera aminoaromatica]HNB06234.1 FAD-linked oxidase C-terminal domain-containing protein [Thauera aminoaromatica]HND59038.1 FAD-linked oxidase C-terminal domain-containing protein [Thauera aminoaromatica]